MKRVKWVVGCMVALWCGTGLAAWSNLGGGDHGGSNWVIATGTYIASNHYNIGTVTIATGATVSVQAYDGSKYGWVSVNASNITVLGTIDASGAGYRGGNGGTGGNGSSSDDSSGTPGTSGSSGEGSYMGSGGFAGIAGYDAGLGINEIKRWGFSGGSGQAGGYAIASGQGDVSTNESVLMGSGGGGGGGGGSGWRWRDCSDGGGGGGGGNPGGGSISLITSNILVIHGAIITKGLALSRGNGVNGQNGIPSGYGGGGGSRDGSGQSSGGSGANVPGTNCYPGGSGSNGGAGAGGGILLKADAVDTVGGAIDNRGGGNVTTNGGTLKIFYVTLVGGSYTNTGRVYLKQFHLPESGTVFEF